MWDLLEYSTSMWNTGSGSSLLDPLNLTLLLTFLCIVLATWFVIGEVVKPLNFPPGPRWIPFVGNTALVKRLSVKHGGFFKALIHLADQHKTPILGLKMGVEKIVVVFSKELMREVFSREEFQARPQNFFYRLRTMGKQRGITMTEGPVWQEQRKFTVKHLRNLGFGKSKMESMILDELQHLLETLKSEKGPLHLHKLLSPCVLNVLWTLTAGKRFGSTDPQLKKLLELMNARSRAFDIAGGLLSRMPFLAYLAPEWSGYKLICSFNREIKSFLDQTIDNHKRTLEPENTRDFIDAFLHQMELCKDGSTTFTEEQLAMVCLDLFVGGSETTGNTLSFALLNMIVHQDVQEQVHQELLQVLGERKLPSLTDRGRLPFTEAVLLESQRCHHVIPVSGLRRAICDVTLGGYTVPKNATVLYSLYSVHHDEHVWEQPMDFRPQRFLTGNKESLIDEMWLFGSGIRKCPANDLAKSFIFLFFTGLLRNFHLKIPNGSESPSLDPIAGISLTPKPYMVELVPRNL